MNAEEKPLVYSCSGCSNVAQMSNHIALSLNKRGLAEMSCIAGIGGHVPKIVKKAKSGRTIIALDGCPLQCTHNCLSQHNIEPQHHIILSEYGLLKNAKKEFDVGVAEKTLEKIIKLIFPVYEIQT